MKIDAEWLARVVKGTAGLGEAPPAGRPTGPLTEGELRHALEDEHGASTLMVRRLAYEVLRVRALIDRDRAGLAEAIGCMVKEASGRTWVVDGRGCYEWDDDRHKAEAGEALRTVIAIGKKALNDSGTLANQAFHPRPCVSPRDPVTRPKREE